MTDRIAFVCNKSKDALVADIVANKGATTGTTIHAYLDRTAIPSDVLGPLVAAHLAAKPVSGTTYQGLEGPFKLEGEFEQAPPAHQIHELIRQGRFSWAGL